MRVAQTAEELFKDGLMGVGVAVKAQEVYSCIIAGGRGNGGG